MHLSLSVDRAKQYNVEVTVDLTEFKKAAVEEVTVNGLPFSVFDASGIEKMLLPFINKTRVCLNRRAVRSMAINQAADYRKSLAVAIKNNLVCKKFDTASRKGRGFLGINVQYIGSNNFELKTLAAQEMTTRHTARDLKECILNVSKKVVHSHAKVYYRLQTVI